MMMVKVDGCNEDEMMRMKKCIDEDQKNHPIHKHLRNHHDRGHYRRQNRPIQMDTHLFCPV